MQYFSDYSILILIYIIYLIYYVFYLYIVIENTHIIVALPNYKNHLSHITFFYFCRPVQSMYRSYSKFTPNLLQFGFENEWTGCLQILRILRILIMSLFLISILGTLLRIFLFLNCMFIFYNIGDISNINSKQKREKEDLDKKNAKKNRVKRTWLICRRTLMSLKKDW